MKFVTPLDCQNKVSRIISIDYGKKRTGLAVTDPQQIIATALETVPSDQLISFLADYFKKEPVESIVVGMPKTLSNQDNEMTPLVRQLTEVLKAKFPDKPVHHIDERFTSKIAQQSMILGGTKKKDRQEKGNTDKISATIILQDYLSRKRPS
jgi:putative Holliday junction resolvase